ncbi:hypothetical protein ACVWXQ_007396 [Bradyrhizobium sp. S3.14.4]
MTLAIDHDRTLEAPAITAAEHHRRLAELAQQLCQCEHGRRLAGAADMVVADADHGDAGVKALAQHAPFGDRAIEQAQRP